MRLGRVGKGSADPERKKPKMVFYNPWKHHTLREVKIGKRELEGKRKEDVEREEGVLRIVEIP